MLQCQPKKYHYPRLQQAFTLLELLIVLVIIGIVIGAASIMFSSAARNAQNIKSAVDLFRGRTQLAQQEATLSTSTLGISIGSDGYQFYRYIEILPNHQWVWKTMQHNKVLSYHRWPTDSQITLAIMNQHNTLLENTPPTTPQIILYPSGETTAFKLIINNQYQITANHEGRITASASNN
jgi:general secretion pathway protein H